MKHFVLTLFSCMSVLLAHAQHRQPVQVQANTQQAEKQNPLNLESSDEKIAIYPNPSNGVFTITAKNLAATTANLSIINVIGNEIFHEELTRSDAQFSVTVDLNNYAKGLYYVKLETDGYSTVRRVVVK